MYRLVLPVVRPLSESAACARRRVTRTIWRWERAEFGLEQGRAPGVIKGRGSRGAGGLLCSVREGRLLGYADVISLTAPHYGWLRSGQIVEERIPAHWIERRPELGSSYWYIASLIVSKDLRQSQPAQAHALSIALQHAIWRLIAAHGRFPARVLGISATAIGRAKFRRAGFQPVVRAPDAVDLRPRFERLIRRRMQLPGVAGGWSDHRPRWLPAQRRNSLKT